ncbi:Protein EXOC-8 a [Aphelenchoides avenae]|nr:Protein EXOC-8 a [Aphelenchus avenae]
METSGQERRSSCGASVHSSDPSHNPLQSLMHKIDGIATVLTNLKENDRVLLQHEVTLLDADSMEPLHPIFLVLMTDSLLIATPTKSDGKYRFRLAQTHSLENAAVVNVKRTFNEQIDAELVLQLLIFPEQMYLMCSNARMKAEVLDAVENAKRRQEQEKSLVRQATIRAKRKGSLAQAASTARSKSVQHGGIGSIPEDDAVEAPLPEEDTQWLKDLVNELQDVISHRHMEQAVEMLSEWKSVKCMDAGINAKFAALEKIVVDMLTNEVRRPGALHGGARALSRPLALLTALGKATYATDIYLKRRSTSLRASARELTISEEPLSYVKQVSSLFINEILDVCKEFSAQTQNYCLVLQWSSSELSVLLSLVRRHVVEVAPTMAVLAHAWRILVGQCDRLVPAGIDLSFEVHRLLAPSLTTALETNFANIIDSVRLRITEEKWRPYNLDSESNLNRYLEEMSDLGLPVDWAVATSPRFSLNIARSACQFARVAISLSRDFSYLNSSYLRSRCDAFMESLWAEYLAHLSAAGESEVHATTCQFVVSQVLPLCQSSYEDDCDILARLLSSKFPSLKKYDQSDAEEEVVNV